MRQFVIYNLSRSSVAPVHARYCATFWCRLVGMTFRRSMPAHEGLLLVQKSDNRVDSAIHMLGVPIDLAVVWINQAGVVVDVRLARRWRLAYISRRPARYVLEIAPTRREDFQIGDQVRFEEVPAD